MRCESINLSAMDRVRLRRSPSLDSGNIGSGVDNDDEEDRSDDGSCNIN